MAAPPAPEGAGGAVGGIVTGLRQSAHHQEELRT